jgi:hypothetical protein
MDSNPISAGYRYVEVCDRFAWTRPVGVPSMLARSVGQFAVDSCTPIEQRCGGWHVAGNCPSRHLGNADPARIFDSPPPSDTLNWSS